MENWLSLIPLILAAGMPLATPVLLAALGGILSERSGVLQLGLEGMLLMGAVTAALVTMATSSNLLGVLAAMSVCAVLGFLHAWLTVTMKGNQIVAGLAMVLFGSGVSIMIGKSIIGRPIQTPYSRIPIPFLWEIPYLGSILFHHDILTYLTMLLVPCLWLLLEKTVPGMKIRAAGESPSTADSLGISVTAARYAAIMGGAALTGIGGAFLTLAHTPFWVEGMSAGKGWIAVAVVIFAAWNPLRAFWGAYLYGVIQALSFRLQAVGVAVPSYFLNMLPYLVPILVLMLMAWKNPGKMIAPAALGQPFERESRS